MLKCCKNKMCFDPSKTEIATEKLVCNNQEGKLEKLKLNIYETVLIYQIARIWERRHTQGAMLDRSEVAIA